MQSILKQNDPSMKIAPTQQNYMNRPRKELGNPNNGNPAYGYRNNNIPPNKIPLIHPMRPSNGNMLSRNGTQPFVNRNIDPNRNMMNRNPMVGNPIKNPASNRGKSIMNSVKYAPRASILDIYGELPNFFPVKEGDEVLNRARETGKHMSIIMERVEHLIQQISSNEKLNHGLSLNKTTIEEEPSESSESLNDKESTQENKSNSSLNTKSSTDEKSDLNSKIDDLLLKNIISQDNKGKKTTVAAVYKMVIKSQEREKKLKTQVPKSIVIKKFSDKEKLDSPTLTPGMVPSPLRDGSSSPSFSKFKSKPINQELVIKTKSPTIRSAQIVQYSPSPNSATSTKFSPLPMSPSSTKSAYSPNSSKVAYSPSSVKSSPSPSLFRKDLEITKSEEIKHKKPQIIHIKTASVVTDQNNIPQDSENVILVSPITPRVHNIQDIPTKKPDETKTKDQEMEDEIDTCSAKPIKWIKGKLIGQGSFGKVYYGMNLDNNQIMAVKQVDIKNKKMVEALNAEINFMKDLRHENIVHYYGINNYFLIIAY